MNPQNPQSAICNQQIIGPHPQFFIFAKGLGLQTSLVEFDCPHSGPLRYLVVSSFSQEFHTQPAVRALASFTLN